MRHYLFLFAAILAVSTLFLTFSCSRANEVKDAEETIEQQEAFNELLDNLESLNRDFGITNTKGGGRDAVKSAADIAGYAVGLAYGADALAWVGGGLAGPCGAVVGFLAGRKYGGIVGSQIFSLVAGYGYDLCSGGCQLVCTNPYISDLNNATCMLSEDASIGEVHNFLLAKIVSQNNDFISKDGHLNIEKICDKSFENAKLYKIDDNLCEDEDYITFIKDLSKEIESIAYSMATNSSGKTCEQSLKELLIQRTKLSETEVDNIFALSSNLMGSSEIGESGIKEYEQAFVDMVDNSKLSKENKDCVKSFGSIAIRSNYFWYAGE